MNPTISITIVCTSEQLALVEERVFALQQDLYRLGAAFSIETTRPPRNPPMDVAEALRNPEAFLAGLEEVQHGIVHQPEPGR